MPETKLVDESKGTPRFAVGVLKGRPLSYSGMSYQFIRHNNETVALFSNGAMAKFYMGPPEPEVNKTPCTFETKLDSVPCASPPPIEEIISEIKLEFDSPDEQKPEEPGPRTIAAYKTKDGGRPRHPCDPVYCVRSQNGMKMNFERELVGTGLREYLWLYAKLREMGRGRITAMSEAFDLYFL